MPQVNLNMILQNFNSFSMSIKAGNLNEAPSSTIQKSMWQAKTRF
jgi:hypothetical protein